MKAWPRCTAVAVVLSLSAAPAAAAQPEPIAVEAAVTAFSPLQPGRRQFGRLEFIGGLVLSSTDPRFGGFSGLVMSDDGQRMVAVSDDGWLFSASLDASDGALTGLHDATLTPLAGPDGRRPRSKWRRDAEALGVWDERGIDGRLLVGYESKPRLEVVDPAGKDPTYRLSIPKALAEGPANGELEALARIQEGPRKDWIIALSESNLDGGKNIRGWMWKGERLDELLLERHDDYLVTDLAMLAGGLTFITLERSFSPLSPPGMALRLFDLAKAEAGAILAGEVLLEARQPIYSIDNMEGIALHRNTGGSLVVTVISDDNFNRALQRTIILQFILSD